MEFIIKENSRVAKIASKKLGAAKMAVVIGRTIHLYKTTRREFLQNETWVKHELCHVQQFKKYGTIIFIAKYLLESILHGYHNNKYEVEARNAEMN